MWSNLTVTGTLNILEAQVLQSYGCRKKKRLTDAQKEKTTRHSTIYRTICHKFLFKRVTISAFSSSPLLKLQQHVCNPRATLSIIIAQILCEVRRPHCERRALWHESLNVVSDFITLSLSLATDPAEIHIILAQLLCRKEEERALNGVLALFEKI